MIADLDETIRKLLQQELPIKNGEIEIKFDQPKREWSAHLNRPTVNLFLYDLRENPVLRQHGWEQIAGNGNGRGDNQLAHLKRTPFRVDCFYMLTTWASDPEDEHRLLSSTLLALFRFPVLPADRLMGSLKKQPFEVPARLANHDRLTNPAEVWSSLDNEMRPSISYIITLALDPWAEITAPLVRTLTMRSGQAIGIPELPSLQTDTVLERVDLGGTVQSAKSGDPLPGIQVAIKGTGLFTTTDTSGRFRLGSLPPGEYILIAWPEEGRPLEKAITLPGDGRAYDLQL
jgi:hypothetical protein